MVVLPMLNGGRIENRWQPMSQLTWCGPSSRSTSFIAAKIGRSGQPVQNEGGRPCTLPAIACCALRAGRPSPRQRAAGSLGEQVGPIGRDELAQALLHHAAGIFARHRQHALALDPGLDVGAPQDGVDAPAR